jgi:outer membrane PBP1 activator LpoA protein
MSAELTTGVLLMREIEQSNQRVSMLVLNNKANFSKKAVGRITFSSSPGDAIKKTIQTLISSGEPQTLILKSQGVDEQQDVVSTFEFEWTLLLKK